MNGPKLSPLHIDDINLVGNTVITIKRMFSKMEMGVSDRQAIAAQVDWLDGARAETTYPPKR